MPSVYPVIPESIVVHLGAPTAYAENVTVAFPDYIKNVVCSEIYPTWEESAIVANTLAIISFALNRVYTEYYPSRGYSFNITNSTAIDQKYIQGRSLFENVVQIVDEIFNSYLRYAGFIEPLAAKFCNGTTSTCDGLSQWGSQSLAQSGATTAEILRNYYGDNIEIVRNVPGRGCGQLLSRFAAAAGGHWSECVAHPDRAEPHLAELSGHPKGRDGRCVRPGRRTRRCARSSRSSR